jgi:hypothetical protein
MCFTNLIDLLVRLVISFGLSEEVRVIKKKTPFCLSRKGVRKKVIKSLNTDGGVHQEIFIFQMHDFHGLFVVSGFF